MALHLIFFGWPTKTKDLGPAYVVDCNHCQNETIFRLWKTRQWFTLYFIPLLPLEFSNHLLVCEICGVAAELEGDEVTEAKEAVQKLEPLLDSEKDP